MLRPFYPRDILLLKSLQGNCLTLGLEGELLCLGSPLAEALKGCLPLSRRRSFTYILEDGAGPDRLVGFAQLLRRSGVAAGDIVYLAPPLGERDEAPDIWQKLLAHLAAVAGQRGMLRLYARLRAEDSEGIAAFRRAGFFPYAWEEVFQWEGSQEGAAALSGASLSPAKPHHAWAIKQLYALATPKAVQEAEGMVVPGLAGQGDQWLVLEGQGEIPAAVSIRQTPRGSWLKAILAPAAEAGAEGILRGALAELGEGLRLPLYAVARHYQASFAEALAATGFRPYVRQCLLVRPVVAAARRTKPVATPILEKRAEAIPTASVTGRIGSLFL